MFNFIFGSTVIIDKTIDLFDGFKEEAPYIQQKREEALKTMKQNGIVPILEGGKFSRKITVLTKH